METELLFTVRQWCGLAIVLGCLAMMTAMLLDAREGAKGK